MMRRKQLKRLTAMVLSLVMALPGAAPSYALPDAQVHTGSRGAMPGYEELRDSDYTLYLVKCGAADPSLIPDGYKKGVLQSATDQAKGRDKTTGYTWGYVENGSSIIYGRQDTNGSSLSGGLRYMSNAIKYDNNVSGITYEFEMPEGERTYQVTLGCKNPWDTRTADITMEGKTVKSSWNLAKGSLVEETFQVTVSDGVLDVWVHNPSRANSGQDSMLSYIIIKVLYDQEYLKERIKDYTLTEEQREKYSVQSLEKYDEAYTYALRAARSDQPVSHEEIDSNLKKLIKKYEGLTLKQEPKTYTSFSGTDGEVWLDTNGTPIQAHGGQVQRFTYKGESKWYWYGEDKTDGYRTVDGGVRVYSSTDLYNWTDEGIALRNLTDAYDFEEDYFKALYGGYTEAEKEKVLLAINDTTSVLERPKVIYNEKNDNYVMWFHADGPTETSSSNYAAASAGVAVSESPTGPFRFIDRYRLNYVDGKYDESKGMARDMNLFVDDDKTAYIMYSSEENATLFISKLNEDYTYLTADPKNAVAGRDYLRSETFAGAKREAPAMFKYNGNYYLMTSGCTGWGANQASFAVSENGVLGDWKTVGDPCITDTTVCQYTNALTFGTQSTNIIPIDPSRGKFIYMGDRWNNESPGQNELIDPRYVWLPVEFDGAGNMLLRPYVDWTLNLLDYMAPVTVETALPKTILKGTGLEDLPGTIQVTAGGEPKETPVDWTLVSGDLNQTGPVVINGIMTAVGNRKITINGFVYSGDMEYLVDCGILDAEQSPGSSEIYEDLKAKVSLKNLTPDQKKEDGNTWGYGPGCLARTYQSVSGLHSTGWYGNENKTGSKFSYEFTLDRGTYTITTGHTEWWSAGRETKVSASYGNNGQTEVKELGSASWSSGNGGTMQNVTGTITVPQDNTAVTLTFTAGGGQAPVVSYIAMEKSGITEILSGDINTAVEVGEVPDLPKKAEVEMADGQIISKNVTWKLPEDGFKNPWETEVVTGTLEGTDVTLTATVEVVPDRLVYFIDTGTADGQISKAHGSISQIMELKNQAPDQVFDGTWGYVDDGVKPRTRKDGGKFENGFYAETDKEIIYKLTLPAGSYRFASGYQEWWAEWESGRSMKTSLVYEDEAGEQRTLDLGVLTLGNDMDGHVLESKSDVSLSSESLVEFHVKKNASLDVVLSWLAVERMEKLSSTEIVDRDYEALKVHNIDEVRGNLTLPLIGENGSHITWESSDEAVIMTKGLDEGTPIGVVERPDEAAAVTLTAEIRSGDVTRRKEFTAHVVPRPEEKNPDAYIFAYFKGEGQKNGEQIYMAASTDGKNWEDLNNSKPVITSSLGEKGLRDPFIMRSAEGDKFYLIATDLKIYGNNDWTAAQSSGSRSIMIWESQDLVNWSDQRMVEVAAEGAGCTWAPEAFYDETTGEYLVFWSSKIPKNQDVENNDYTHRVYYAKTRDFYTFTEPRVWLELHNKDKKAISVIDATIIQVGDTYYRFTKNEASEPHKEGMPSGGKYTILEESGSLLGEWTEIPSNINQLSGVEGAAGFKLNGVDEWCLLLDDFGGKGYFPLITDDIGTGQFTRPDPDEYSFPGTMRHGSVLPVTESEYQSLMEEYGPAMLHSPDIEGTELAEIIIGEASPIYEDTFDSYEENDRAEMGETLKSTDGLNQYTMRNAAFAVKKDVNSNCFLSAEAVSEVKLAQADISLEAAAGLKDALIMMDVMIPGTEENPVKAYAQIGAKNDRSYVKFDLKESCVNIRENNKDSKVPYSFLAGETYHVAVLYKDGSASAYVNGKLVHKKEISNYTEVGMAGIAVGAGGKIDNVKIYDASADRTEYQSLIEEMEKIKKEDYDKEGWDEFEQALQKAEKLLKSQVASREDLIQYFDALNQAFLNLTAQAEYYTDRIKITKNPYQTEYELYDDFNPNGMEVTRIRMASGSNAERKNLLEEEEYDLEYDFTQLGDALVTVSYTDVGKSGQEEIFTDTVTVSVKKEITKDWYYTSKIAVTRDPVKKQYEVDEEFDATGMEVTEYLKATDSNASPKKRVLSEEEYDTIYDFSVEGNKKVVIEYYGTNKAGEEKRFTDYVVVKVNADNGREILYTTGIRIAADAFKTEYETGEELNPEGLLIKRGVVRRDGTEDEETVSKADYVLSYDFSKPGNQTVTISVVAKGESGADQVFETEFQVKVRKPETEKPPVDDPTGDTPSDNKPGTDDPTGDTPSDNKPGTDGPTGDSTGGLSGSGTGGTSGNGTGGLSGGGEGPAAAKGNSSGRGKSYYTEGSWQPVENGWKFYKADHTEPKNEWIYTDWNHSGDWYFFDADGEMVTGWLEADGMKFYLNPESDGTRGRMMTGWILINGFWYYFNPDSDGTRGALLVNTRTLDGYQVDERGVWIQ